MLFVFVFDIEKDIIEIYYDKNNDFFYQDLINVVLKRVRCICQSKRHHLVLKIIIAGHESCFLFIAFLNAHSIINIGQIKLNETISPT